MLCDHPIALLSQGENLFARSLCVPRVLVCILHPAGALASAPLQMFCCVSLLKLRRYKSWFAQICGTLLLWNKLQTACCRSPSSTTGLPSCCTSCCP